MTDGSERAPAGWYNDPHAPHRMRYFDGEVWTNHFHEPGRLPDIGTWLSTTFTVFGSYWKGAVALALITSLVGNVLIWVGIRLLIDDLAVVDDQLLNFDTGTAVGAVGLVLGAFLWQGFGWLAMNRFMQRAHFQANPTVVEALTRAVRRLPKYVGVVLSLGLAAILVAILVAFLAVAVPLLGLLAILGLLVAVVWIIVKLAFLISAIAAAPAGTPVIRASAEVSVGRFWPVLGRFLLLTIGVAVVGQVITVLLGDYGQVIDAEALADVIRVEGDTLIVRDFRFVDLLPSTGSLAVALLIASVAQGASSLITTSAFMRLYLDSGAPSEL